jgi:phospholipase D1/2
MKDSRKPRLEIVVVKATVGDTSKESTALGGLQASILSSLARTARETGHAFGAYHGVATREDGTELPVFVHSKLLAVDNRLLSIGSANCTNRSMHVDGELNLAWECGSSADPLGGSIAELRASLIAEHAGLKPDESLRATRDLVARLDALAESGQTRLRRNPILEPGEIERAPLLESAFDPVRPLDELGIEELGELTRESRQA